MRNIKNAPFKCNIYSSDHAYFQSAQDVVSRVEQLHELTSGLIFDIDQEILTLAHAAATTGLRADVDR